MRELTVRRLALRQRVALMFGLVAFVMSVLLAATTYAIARDYLWAQRRDAALRQAVLHARTVNQAMVSSPPSLSDVLLRVDARAGASSSPVLLWNGRWYDGRYAPGIGSLPDTLVSMAEDGESVMQRLNTRRGPVFAVALPLDRGAYLEIFSLAELERTLRSLGFIFAATTTMTTLVGALIGGWASHRALMPLTSLTSAASGMATGDLATRLPAQTDADLAPIAEAFNRTAAELEARVGRDARFAGNVSHELRTPVTAMVNAVDILGTRADLLDPEGREALDFLTGDVHRFAQMVRDLLDTARIDSGAVELARDEIQLSTHVRSVADRRAGRPVTTGSSEGPAVVTDARLLDRVIENLVDNAESHGRGATRVSVETDGSSARVVVDDAGPGVPLDERARVFERFARLPGSGDGSSEGGAGLGLALVAEHARLLQGRVWVEDSPDGGARFVVEIPLRLR
jgi:signal transduction histidine kinase